MFCFSIKHVLFQYQTCFVSTSNMFCFYIKHVLFLHQTCSVSTSNMFCFYIKHVLFLHQTCFVSTSNMFCFYIKHVLFLHQHVLFLHQTCFVCISNMFCLYIKQVFFCVLLDDPSTSTVSAYFDDEDTLTATISTAHEVYVVEVCIHLSIDNVVTCSLIASLSIRHII